MTVKKQLQYFGLLGMVTMALACNKPTEAPTTALQSPEKVFLGDDFATLFEALPWETIQKVKKGDLIYTRNPALFLDFNYTISENTFNSACGKFIGWDRIVVTSGGEMNLSDFMKKLEETTKAANATKPPKDSIPAKGK